MGGNAARRQIPDQRDDGRHLRVSWHPTRRVVVFSHWRDGVCVATTPVELAEIPSIIAILVKALGDAFQSRAPTSPTPSAESVSRDVREVLTNWFRPRLATICALKPRSAHRRH
jgi:hypothetical protein